MKRKHIAISLLLALAANLTTAAAPDSEPASSPDKPNNLPPTCSRSTRTANTNNP